MSARAPFARWSIISAARARRSKRYLRGGASEPQICSREAAEREIEACGKFGVALVALGEAHYRSGCR